MQAGGGMCVPIEQAVELGQRPAAQQRERTAEAGAHACEIVVQSRVDFHRVGVLREIQQCAVDVEEQRPAVVAAGPGRRRQGVRVLAWKCGHLGPKAPETLVIVTEHA
jgi:hypothetical protein